MASASRVPDRLHQTFTPVKVFTHPSGVAITVTQRDGTPLHSFAIGKVFVDKEGNAQRTSYLNRRHLSAVRALLDELEEFLDSEADRTSVRRFAGGTGG